MDDSYVPDFTNEKVSSSNEEHEPQPKRRRRSNRIWLKDRDFASSEEAEAVVDRRVWSKCAVESTAAGLRVEYRCTKGTYRLRECPAGLYLLFRNTSMLIMSRTPPRGLSEELKTFVREKFDEGNRKPNVLLHLIRQRKLKEPEKSKLVTFLRALRYVLSIQVRNGTCKNEC